MIVYTGGTFDLFHAGHVEFLARCRELVGTSPRGKLVVGLNTDEFVEEFKGRRPVIPYDDRRAVVKACAHVDEVMINASGADSRPTIERAKADVVVIGSDWYGRNYLEQLSVTWEWLHEQGIALAFVPRITPISSTQIREKVMQ